MTFKIYSGTLIGPYHSRKNLPNQDAFFVDIYEEWLIGGVADGAGSLEFSEIGAKEALRAAHDTMINELVQRPLIEVLKKSVEAARAAQTSFENYKQYGSTLTVFILGKTGEWAVAAVGDSFAVVHTAEGEHELITGTLVRDYANITELLTSKTINPVYKTGENALGVSCSSDGLEYVSLESGEAVKGFWTPLVKRALNDELEILPLFDWLDSKGRISDDTTLVTAVKGD